MDKHVGTGFYFSFPFSDPPSDSVRKFQLCLVPLSTSAHTLPDFNTHAAKSEPVSHHLTCSVEAASLLGRALVRMQQSILMSQNERGNV